MKSTTWNPGNALTSGEWAKSCAVAEFRMRQSRVPMLRLLLC